MDERCRVGGRPCALRQEPEGQASDFAALGGEGSYEGVLARVDRRHRDVLREPAHGLQAGG